MISPKKNGVATYLASKDNFSSQGLSTYSQGHVVRNDSMPFNLNLQLDSNVSFSASVNPQNIQVNNGWILTGNIVFKKKKMEAICTFKTKDQIEGYDLIYNANFPKMMFLNFYRKNLP